MIRRADERGFSLPELIMVIMVIAILAVVVSPNAALFPTMKLNAAAQRVASDLRYAQAQAHREGGPVGLSFSSSTKYTVVHTAARTAVADPLDPTKSLAFSTAADTRFKGVTWTWDFSGNSSLLLFDSLGQPRDNSYDVALEPGLVHLTLSGKTATVTVEAVTGRVSITEAS